MRNDRVLIIDDNPDNRALIHILLECDGFEVQTAGHAPEALEVLKNFHPRLILMDIQLPGTDGLELTRHLRRNPDMSDVAIIALTAYAMKADENKALAAGCDGYVTKPIETRTFTSLVRSYLKSSRPS